MNIISVYTGHYLVFFVFAVSIVLNIRQIIKWWCSEYLQGTIVRTLTLATLNGSICISLIFLVLQADWVFSNHNEAVGDTTAFLWLVFDALLVIYLVSLSVLLDVVRVILEGCEKDKKRLDNIKKGYYECVNFQSPDDKLVDEEVVKELKDSLKVAIKDAEILRSRYEKSVGD